ncbi:MAG: fumarate hydratase [Erysipelotrichaceae bacterium]|nr:fumarate hydratase [Erysipelotrichaceae bacterium]MDY5252076.1 fumarate hydratase [Erysipelotrichaceae bacterium]
MRIIKVETIKEKIAKACDTMLFAYPEDIAKAIEQTAKNEQANAKIAMELLLKNSEIAQTKHIPICQDTGMVIVFVHVGRQVMFDGNIDEAINEGVRLGYRDNYLRQSVVSDPLFKRENTKDNTPAIIYYDYIDGDKVIIEMMAKGFGSENTSNLAMLKPAQGIEGVKAFVLDTVKKAGPNACPPMIIGVGIGGTFELAPMLAKKALLRELSVSNPHQDYQQLEDELLQAINELNIGPLGLKGKTTALKVQIEYYPTHIAGLPVAVNICCHVSRHKRMVI